MIKAIQSAIAGIQKASAQLDKSAQNIADSGSKPETPIKDIVSIKQSEINFKANAQTLDVINDLAGEILKKLD